MGDFNRERSSSRSSGSRFGRGSSDRGESRGFGRSPRRGESDSGESKGFGRTKSGRPFAGRSSGGRFGRDSEGGFRRGTGSRFDGGKSRADYEMHKVICDKCGKECEVPFKPTNSKPVYCSDCFNNEDTPRREPSSRVQAAPIASTKDLDLINEKLNKIMKALKIE